MTAVGTEIWTNCPWRHWTLVSDPWPQPRDSKPRKLGSSQCTICKTKGILEERMPSLPLKGGPEMTATVDYPQRQVVQIDEEWWGKKTPKLTLQLTLEEPQLTLDTRRKACGFLSRHPCHLVQNTRSGKLSQKSSTIMRVSGEAKNGYS